MPGGRTLLVPLLQQRVDDGARVRLPRAPPPATPRPLPRAERRRRRGAAVAAASDERGAVALRVLGVLLGEDDEEEDAPAPSAKKQAEKKILEALEYQAVDTGLRFGSFDSSNELAGPARKLKPMQCGCPDGTSIVVNRK